MTLGRLALRHAAGRPVRSLLTVAAVAVSVFLLAFVRSIVTSLEAAVSAAATDRIVVGSAVSLFQALPESYVESIRGIDGVRDATVWTWFGGRYQKPENFFAQFAVDPDVMLRMFPEAVLPEEQKQAFREDRQGAIAGQALVEKYGWKLGDRIPILGTIYTRLDGGEWAFNLRGIYRATKPNVDEVTMFFHYDLLREALESGAAAGPKGTSVVFVDLDDDATPAQVATAIDARYEQGPQRTRTQPEAAFQASFIGMLGNLPVFLGTIGAAILVALLLGIVNTMTMAGRERTRTYGILSALGFPKAAIVRTTVLEALWLVGTGTALGMGLAAASQDPLRRLFGTQIPQYHIATETYVAAGLVALVVAVVAGWLPARRAIRARAADALRRGA